MVVEESPSRRVSRGVCVVIASDDATLRRELLVGLAEHTNWVLAARQVQSVIEAADEDVTPDVVVLDGRSGDRLLLSGMLRGEPVKIVITNDSTSAAEAFEAGADDCVQWPCDLGELTSRIQARLGAATRLQGEVLRGPHGLEMWPKAYEVRVNGAALDLTPKEFALLHLFLGNRGVLISADGVSQSIWGHETFGTRNFVEAHISRMRHKLKAAGLPDVITTIRGVGYKMP